MVVLGSGGSRAFSLHSVSMLSRCFGVCVYTCAHCLCLCRFPGLSTPIRTHGRDGAPGIAPAAPELSAAVRHRRDGQVFRGQNPHLAKCTAKLHHSYNSYSLIEIALFVFFFFVSAVELAQVGSSPKISRIPRSRQVHQSYFTSIFTTLWSLFFSFIVVLSSLPDIVPFPVISPLSLSLLSRFP